LVHIRGSSYVAKAGIDGHRKIRVEDLYYEKERDIPDLET
jgi:hypothetical protein